MENYLILLIALLDILAIIAVTVLQLRNARMDKETVFLIRFTIARIKPGNFITNALQIQPVKKRRELRYVKKLPVRSQTSQKQQMGKAQQSHY